MCKTVKRKTKGKMLDISYIFRYRYLWHHRVVQHHGVRCLDVALDLVCLGEHHLGHVIGVGADLDTNWV